MRSVLRCKCLHWASHPTRRGWCVPSCEDSAQTSPATCAKLGNYSRFMYLFWAISSNCYSVFRLSTSTATTSCSTTCCTTSTRSSPSSAETSPHWAGLNWEPSQTNPRTNHPRLFSQTFIHFTETSSVVSVLSKVKLQNIGGWRWHKKFCPRVKINEVTFLWTLDYFGFWIYGLIKFSR